MVTVMDVLRACRVASEDWPVMTVLRQLGVGTYAECAQAVDDAYRANLVRYCSERKHLVTTEDGRLMLSQERG